jgi:hypothetical protein
MFTFVSACAVLGGAMAVVGGGWARAFGFVALLVSAHVLATIVGTRLRDSSSRVEKWRADHGAPSERPRPQALTAAELAALSGTPLAAHEPARIRTAMALGAGMITGGFGGAAAIPLVAGPETTGAGLALGALSCGVICAWFALLMTHFWTVARRAWRHAQGEAAPATPRSKRWFGRV